MSPFITFGCHGPLKFANLAKSSHQWQPWAVLWQAVMTSGSKKHVKWLLAHHSLDRLLSPFSRHSWMCLWRKRAKSNCPWWSCVFAYNLKAKFCCHGADILPLKSCTSRTRAVHKFHGFQSVVHWPWSTALHGDTLALWGAWMSLRQPGHARWQPELHSSAHSGLLVLQYHRLIYEKFPKTH